MNETKNDNANAHHINVNQPSFDHMKKLKVISEKLLNNLPLFMFGLLMVMIMAVDIL